ncbi:hypothetical protein PI87_21980 [Ralstonia sp. A12]|uniref:copper-binding protein n=1 Tax=Ralstonia sp. A12 TaxID=1217052 RepID=UPI00057437BA|nr:copper-binding protein [Ralstonia sp. A12]KHK50952.1 hypothetical protein PI87_21980 [Ralstonia sp. A12]
MKLKIIHAMTLSAVLSLSFVVWSGVAIAQNTSASEGQNTAVPAGSDLIDGEVRKVDKGAGRLTIKHGPIKDLDMPSMTMVYQVEKAALLDNVQAGDNLRFRLKSEGGKFVVTEVQSTH